MQFKRNGTKETLGIGLKRISETVEIQPPCAVYDDQVEVMNAELQEFESDKDLNIHIERVDAYGDLIVNVDGCIKNDEDFDLVVEIEDLLFNLNIFESMLNIDEGDGVMLEIDITDDDDLDEILDNWKNSLYEFDEDSIAKIESLYTGGYKPSQELVAKMQAMCM
jgi:hypothetical protein